MKKKIYVSGNRLLKEDSMPLKIMQKLQESFPEIEFKEFDPTENFPEERNLNILDTVIGINRVEIIDNVDSIVSGRVYSLHDFDLGFNLKLMKKAGKISKVKIIGVPAHLSEKQAITGVKKAIRTSFK